MHRLICFFLTLSFLAPYLAYAAGGPGKSVSVRGYTRKDGTYVAPHMRSAPDGNFSNNWSTLGNVNPYTGTPGTKVAPDTSREYVPSPSSYSSPSRASVEPTEQGDLYNRDEYGPSVPEVARAAKPVPSAKVRHRTAALSAKGTAGAQCGKGYRKEGQECVARKMPEHAKLNYFGDGWECKRGFHQTGADCTRVILPAHAKLDYFGNSWECVRGYQARGAECIAVDIPKNGKLDYFGNNWECKKGFRAVRGGCETVELPKNAQLNYFGNDWECKRGYRRQGYDCVSVL